MIVLLGTYLYRTKQHRTLRQAALQLYRSNGGILGNQPNLKGFYKGYMSQFYTTIPFLSLYFMFTEFFNNIIKENLKTYGKALPISPSSSSTAPKSSQDLFTWKYAALSGLIGGICALAVATPFEFFRQRLITEWPHRRQVLGSLKQLDTKTLWKMVVLHQHVSDTNQAEAKQALLQVRRRCHDELRTKLLHQSPRFVARKAVGAITKNILRNIFRR